MEKTGICLTLACTITLIAAGTIFIETVKQTEKNIYTSLRAYDYFLDDETSFTTQVKACTNVHVALLRPSGDVIYEIFIGGYNNTMSAIRRYAARPPFLDRWDGNIISCDNYRTFRFNWTNGVITVEKEQNKVWTTFLMLNSGPLHVADIGVSTSLYDRGQWKITTKDESITFATLPLNEVDIADYGFSAINATDFGFEVKTCSRASIKLNNSSVLSHSVILKTITNNITIDEDKHELRKYKMDVNFGSGFNCSSFTLFKVSWGNGLLLLNSPQVCGLQKTENVGNITALSIKVLVYEDPGIWKIHEKVSMSPCDVSSEVNTTSPIIKSELSTIPGTVYENASCTMLCINSSEEDMEPTQLQKMVTQLKKELAVSKNKTSQHIRKLTCATDDRQSAASIGYLGVIILTSIAFGIIVMDLPTLRTAFGLMRQNLSKKHSGKY